MPATGWEKYLVEKGALNKPNTGPNAYMFQYRTERMYEHEDDLLALQIREERFMTHDDWKARQEELKRQDGISEAVGELPEVPEERDGDDDG